MDYPKRLIEVDLPIKRISAHARREKSIRHGHISTLHIWWARRPLAACRAVICAALWPDPADENCPQDFRDAAARLISQFAEKVYNTNALHETASKESFGQWEGIVAAKSKGIELDPHDRAHLNKLRFALLDFIADFSNWDNSTISAYLETARALTSAAHETLGGEPRTRPLVVDPFAGGGAIPLEALRVGANAFASDLNPVAVLLNKVVLEYIPKYGQRLADEVSAWRDQIYGHAKSVLAEFYPEECDGTKPAAYLWARTIVSESPGVSQAAVEVPVIRSMWLSNKTARLSALRWVRDAKGKIKTETATVAYGNGVQVPVVRPLLEIFQPNSPAEVEAGTSRGGAVTCPVTGFTTPVDRVRQQLASRRGGSADARLLCAITTPPNGSGRVFRSPDRRDHQAVIRATKALSEWRSRHVGKLPLLPEGNLNHLRGFFNVVLYGMTTWGDLFTPRQALSLCHIVERVKCISTTYEDKQLGEAVQTCLALALDRCADKCASVVVWDLAWQKVAHVFGRQALPMVWDFAEANILSEIGWTGACEWVLRVIEHNARSHLTPGSSTVASATAHPLPDDSADAIVTDPPYYAAIPYADLSDFFYSWLQRSVGEIHTQLFDLPLTPKDDECVSLSHRAAMYRQKDAAWFEKMMAKACSECRRVAKPLGICVLVFANKETSGWEAMLAALINSGWIITASWPIDTEMGTRLRARNSAALASSVHLVCRPRENPDGSLCTEVVGEWREVLQELPGRINEWLPRLASEGVVGADAIFSCIGPALEIFSRYSRVERADGKSVALGEYLVEVWAAVAKEALSLLFKDADTGGLEPDARLTAMWLWTLRPEPSGTNGNGSREEEADEGQNAEDEEPQDRPVTGGGYAIEFDAARKIAQGLGANLDTLGSVVEVKGKTARLLLVSEREPFLFAKPRSLKSMSQPSQPTNTLQTTRRGKSKRPAKGQQSFRVNEGDGLSSQPAMQREAGADVSPYDVESTEWTTAKTVLDRVHQSMLLFARGRADTLKRFLVDDGIGKESRFWKLAQALSALYPRGSDEKRWIDGVLARKKGLGL